MSNRTVDLIIAVIVLVLVGSTVVAASPDEHPLKFGP
jgi:hypothetical protein